MKRAQNSGKSTQQEIVAVRSGSQDRHALYVREKRDSELCVKRLGCRSGSEWEEEVAPTNPPKDDSTRGSSHTDEITTYRASGVMTCSPVRIAKCENGHRGRSIHE
ncbi:uncharacterized protein LOC132041426 [Lycium ferocissimum]|uniref:uncharacterized protein LOC132041426 n=1 Tax=Lycium ferocissimum TaxID=112874 RepID=UPI002814ECEA|nr:uncharacterized protein LOC132041426 [Lycium ferocissimum]